MADESDWNRAYRDVIAKGRLRVEPPSPETLVAYARGELPEAEMERVRETLAYYPDLAIALTEDASATEDAPYLTREQLATDWESLQQRLKGPTVDAPVFVRETSRRWQWATAASLLLCVVLAGLYVKSAMSVRALRDDLQRPQANVERLELFDENSRGRTVPAKIMRLKPSTSHLMLILTLAATTPTENFRVEMLEAEVSPPSMIWTSPIQRSKDGTFVVDVPRSFLWHAAYRLNLYENGRATPIATYSLRLEE
jgi:hypothetical protein